MRILVAGLGAVGQRHARNLRTLLGDDLELHALRQRRDRAVITSELAREPTRDVEAELGCTVHLSLETALDARPDAVVVATPSSAHLEIMLAAAEAGCALYVEKPLAHEWYGVERLVALSRTLTTMVGCQWRFHPAVRLLRRGLAANAFGRIVQGNLHYGEWLPGWHPYEDFRASYAARPELGGGVTLTQIHDYDLADALFGAPLAVQAVGGSRSSLAIPVDDVMNTLAEHESPAGPLTVSLSQNLVQRTPERTLRIIGEGGDVSLDLLKGRFDAVRADGQRVRHDFRGYARNTMFLDAMRHFLDAVQRRVPTEIPIAIGARVLRTALAARRAAETGERIILEPLGVQ
jgi:predicted dehydrogenase